MEAIKQVLIEAGAITMAGDTMTLSNPAAIYAAEAEPQRKLIVKPVADYFKDRGITTVIGMDETKSVLARTLARALNSALVTVCTAIAARGDSGEIFIPDHFKPLIEKQKVLIIDDFVTDPSDLLKLIEYVHDHKGLVTGLSVIVEGPDLFSNNFHMVPLRHRLLSSRHLSL